MVAIEEVKLISKEYALYPVLEIRQLYQYAAQYQNLIQKIEYLTFENNNLKNKIAQLESYGHSLEDVSISSTK